MSGPGNVALPEERDTNSHLWLTASVLPAQCEAFLDDPLARPLDPECTA